MPEVTNAKNVVQVMSRGFVVNTFHFFGGGVQEKSVLLGMEGGNEENMKQR